jgi:ribosome maturation factor RimP
MESNNSNDLKHLQGKKVQINYVSPAQEETTVSGRLLEVTADTIVVDGAVMRTQLSRKQMKIVSIDYVAEPKDTIMLNMVIRKGKAKLTVADWKEIGAMISKGLTKGKDSPKGVDWEMWGSL